MGEDLDSKFKDCLKRDKLKQTAEARVLAKKELRVAFDDIKTAKDGIKESRWKWSTIQAYYSMFHAARALVYSLGYREKSHYCLRVALEFLFVKTEKLSVEFVDLFQMAKIMRENADYEENFSADGAKKIVLRAYEFIKNAEKILDIK